MVTEWLNRLAFVRNFSESNGTEQEWEELRKGSQNAEVDPRVSPNYLSAVNNSNWGHSGSI